MDEMSARIEAAMPIVKHFLRRLRVPADKLEEEKQTLRISLWKAIKKQETTHQDWSLVTLFEYDGQNEC